MREVFANHTAARASDTLIFDTTQHSTPSVFVRAIGLLLLSILNTLLALFGFQSHVQICFAIQIDRVPNGICRRQYYLKGASCRQNRVVLQRVPAIALAL